MHTMTHMSCSFADKLPAGNFALNCLNNIGDLLILDWKKGARNG